MGINTPRESPREKHVDRNSKDYLASCVISQGYDTVENAEKDGNNASQTVKENNLSGTTTANDDATGKWTPLFPMDFASISDALFDYASNGLRTLILAKRDLTEEEGASSSATSWSLK